MITAPVNKIIPFSSVDGYGNRTAIFLQGCNQDCLYCHNPETIHTCIGCGACVAACPAGALTLCENVTNAAENAADCDGAVNGPERTAAAPVPYVRYDLSKCCNCDTCIKTCKRSASPKIRNLTPEQVMEEICPYFPFINGITTSGGECTLHLEFLTELYRLVKAAGKTTYTDTNGQIPLWKNESYLEVTDKTMIDLKAGTEEDHRKLTGLGVETPVENIRQMAKMDKLYEIRTVVVPGVVDNLRTVELGASLIAAYPHVRYKLIKFRHYGVRESFRNTREPSDEEMNGLKQRALNLGVREVIIT